MKTQNGRSTLILSLIVIIFATPMNLHAQSKDQKKADKSIEVQRFNRHLTDYQNNSKKVKTQSAMSYKDNEQLTGDIARLTDDLNSIKQQFPNINLTVYESQLAVAEKDFAEMLTVSNGKSEIKKYVQEKKVIAEKVYETARDPNVFGKEKANRLHELCVQLDYISALQKIQSGIKQFPDKTGDTYLTVWNSAENKYILEEFPELFKSTISNSTNRINASIELAYAEKGKGKSRLGSAVDAAEAALILCKAILLVLPSESGIAKLQQDAQAAYDKLSGEVDAAIYTSDYHKQNVGKIVFSKSPITIKNENPAMMTGSFLAGDLIYGMLYLKGTIVEITKLGHANIKINLAAFVDKNDGPLDISSANTVASFLMKWDDKFTTSTTVNVEVAQDPSTSIHPEVGISFVNMFTELSSRKHTIRIIVTASGKEYGSTGSELGSGTFELDCSSGQDKYLALGKELNKVKISRARMPKAEKSDKSIEQLVWNALKEDGITPIRVVLQDKEWYVERNKNTGIILNRQITAAFAQKLADGTTCICRFATFQQDHDGAVYTKMFLRNPPSGDFQIAIENINR